jgi:hypothetical protein
MSLRGDSGREDADEQEFTIDGKLYKYWGRGMVVRNWVPMKN